MNSRLLVIDDEREQSELLSLLLSRNLKGLEVLRARDGAQGLQMARELLPDVVILDARMPEMDGFEVCRALKNDPMTERIPVLMISGHMVETRHRVSGLEAGADGYICKPFEPAELVAQVKALLRLKKKEDALEKALDRRTQQLEWSELHYRTLFQRAPVGIAVSTVDGTILDTNDSLARMMGYTREELMQKKAPDTYVNLEDRLRLLADVGRDGAVRDRHIQYKKKDGAVFDVYVTMSRITTEGKEVLLTVFMDVTNTLHADAELKRLARAVEQSAESVVITDTEGVIQYVNPGFTHITGFSREEVLGQTPRVLKSGRHDGAFYEEMWKTLKVGLPWRGRFINMRKDGSIYEVEQTISPIRDAEGHIVNYVSVSQDLSREIQLETEFRQAQKLESIGRLAGGVAHDFNNLLTSILGFGELLLHQMEAENPYRGDIEEIVHAGERAAKLTRQLLAFGRKQIAYMRPQDLNSIVADMDKLLRRTLGEDVELVTLLGEGIRPIFSDVGLIEQVIMNLAVNARDAMAEGGKLTLATQNVTLDEEFCREHIDFTPGQYVLLTVSDVGSGMTEEVLEHAFEPFYTTKGQGKGTGLGLSTVYGIIKQSKGHILIESKEGQGTTFKIYFTAAEGMSAPAVPSVEGTLPSGSETILVVEDEDTVRRLTIRILDSLGYQVLQARHGEEALRVAETHPSPIDLVLTDVVMPQLGGPEMVEYLKERYPDIKVLFMSGFTEGRAIEQIYEKHAASLVQKPFTQRAIAAKIRETLDRDRSSI